MGPDTKPAWQQSFEDWKRLLKDANAEELLADPAAIWDEAWRHAAMIAVAVAGQHSADIAQQIERKLIRE